MTLLKIQAVVFLEIAKAFFPSDMPQKTWLSAI